MIPIPDIKLKDFLGWLPLVLLVATLMGLMGWGMYIEGTQYHYGCRRIEVLTSVQPVSDWSGEISGYTYTTQSNQVLNLDRAYPLNTPTCVEMGNIPNE